MKLLMFAIAAVILAALVLAVIAKGTKGQAGGERPRRKMPLTDREQAMFNRLTQSLPDSVVMPQVAFSALLTARARQTRNTFDRKVADFVICDRAFQVLAIVELDDKSHAGKEARDARRDQILSDSGYRVIRYPNVPDIDRVRADLTPPPSTPQPAVGQLPAGRRVSRSS